MPGDPLFAGEIPPVAVVRERLARAATEASLLRKLLPLAIRREKEAVRLAKMVQEQEASANAST
jgi:hypothetical protein